MYREQIIHPKKLNLSRTLKPSLAPEARRNRDEQTAPFQDENSIIPQLLVEDRACERKTRFVCI